MNTKNTNKKLDTKKELNSKKNSSTKSNLNKKKTSNTKTKADVKKEVKEVSTKKVITTKNVNKNNNGIKSLSGKKSLKKKKGFTLVEIIAVIVIMGILLLVVVPSVSNLMKSNDEKKYTSYYDIVQAGLEKYARTRKSEVGGTQGVGCIDDRTLSEIIKLGYVKAFDQEEDVFCGSPKEFDAGLLNDWGIDSSKEYANMRVEGDHGDITTKLSIICVKVNSNGKYADEPEYVNLVEVGPECKPTEMYEPTDKFIFCIFMMVELPQLVECLHSTIMEQVQQLTELLQKAIINLMDGIMGTVQILLK